MLVIVLVASRGGTDTATTSTPSTTTTSQEAVGVLGQAKMRSAGGRAYAVVQIVRQGGTLAMVFRGQGIPRHGDASVYAMWLTNSAGGSPKRLGFVRKQASSGGKLEFVGALPSPLSLVP